MTTTIARDQECQYAIWDPALGEMRPCGAPATRIHFPSARVRKFTGHRESVTLCPAHKAFFEDALPPEAQG